jgi:predicted transcriptional regulator
LQSNQPREQSLAGSGLCAKDVMLKELVWGSPEDGVQQAITKMQQYNSGYLMVGIDGVLDGIVSNSNITGALSPYLRPVFAKWRRPLDDATLQIRIKWIMSRPVHIVKPETPLANVMENMCRYGVLCLPVVDQQGKVQGLVTEAGIFKVLLGLKSSPGISASDNEHKEQSISDHREIESTPTMEPDLVAPV